MGKTTRGFVLGLSVAALGVGAYCVYKNKDKLFKSEEIVNEDGTITKKRAYVDLDNIKEKTSEAVNKAKETAQDTIKTAQDKLGFKKETEVNVEDAEEVVETEDDVVVEVVDDTTEA